MDTILRARNNDSLTLEQMRASLPAIFAPEAHPSRSDRYVYISTEDMLSKLLEHDFLPVEARVSRSRDEDRRAHTKHMVRLRHRSALIPAQNRQVGDTAFEVVLRNAHDGTAAYSFNAGLFRLICLNGCVVSDGTVASIHVKHKGNREKQLDNVIEGAYTVLEQGPKVIEHVQAWKGIELSRDEQMVYAEGARTLRFGDIEGNVETPITAEQLLGARRYADQGNSLWNTFNRVQENVIRGGLSAPGYDANNRRRVVTTRQVKAIDGDIRLNKALWSLAEEMARLKAA